MCSSATSALVLHLWSPQYYYCVHHRLACETLNVSAVCLRFYIWSATCNSRDHTYLLGVLHQTPQTPVKYNPIFVVDSRGRLADTDVRWSTISSAADDRTEDEMRPTNMTSAGEAREFPLEDGQSTHVGVMRQPKSR